MRRSKVEVGIHIVWATYNRMPLLTKFVEEAVYSFILHEAQALKCEVLAAGGMPDHIHLSKFSQRIGSFSRA
jgi:putative transposase